MSVSDGEHVLVVPRAVFEEAGVFHGFSPDVDRYWPRLLDPRHLLFLPRAQAEDDPRFKQIIPYLMLKCGDQVFNYTRGQKGTEARLRALRSLGVGGHINPEDGAAIEEQYPAALQRELREEVHLETTFTERRLGLINDDTSPVGQVHLGFVHVLELVEPKARRREQVLTNAGFTPLAELRERREEFETWSQFLLEDDWLSEPEA